MSFIETAKSFREMVKSFRRVTKLFREKFIYIIDIFDAITA